MSETRTPRTDGNAGIATNALGENVECVPASLARQLERELADMTDDYMRRHKDACDRAMRIADLERELAEARKDAERLRYAMDDIDGFVNVRNDKYDYAIKIAEENGREVPNEDDELNGVRMLIDAARAGQSKEATSPPP